MRQSFPVICVGGSAGSQHAYVNFLKNLPFDTGAAVVIVNHVSRYPATLDKVLSRYTSMQIELIIDKLLIQPNCVFIIPSDYDLHVPEGRFRLEPKSKSRGWPDVITVFLRSLVHHWSGTVIAVIVSGLDSDGAEALQEVKAAGGVTFAQTPETAEWSDMPESAIKTGYVDYVLSVEEIAQKVAQIATENAFP